MDGWMDGPGTLFILVFGLSEGINLPRERERERAERRGRVELVETRPWRELLSFSLSLSLSLSPSIGVMILSFPCKTTEKKKSLVLL